LSYIYYFVDYNLLVADPVFVKLRVGNLDELARLFNDPNLPEWSISQIEAEFNNDCARLLGFRLLGHLVAATIFHVVAGEAHLVNLVVDRSFRRQGLARLLLEQSFEMLKSDERVCQVFLEVKKSSLAAQALYASVGMQIVGERKNYYIKTGEDAILMRGSL
jgi:ribosomal-protein-alanine N-acetyltransferase